LNEEELKALNNLVEQYLIFAEEQAMRRIPMYMKDWIAKLDAFLQLNDRDILQNAGSVSHELAKQSAELEYDKYKKQQQKVSSKVDDDFENTIKQIENKKSKKD